MQPIVSTFLAFVMLADIAFGCCGPACALTRQVKAGTTQPEGSTPPAAASGCTNPCCQHRQPAAPRTETPADRESPPAAPASPCPCCNRDSTFLIPPAPAESIDLDLSADAVPLAADHTSLQSLAGPTHAFGSCEGPCWFLAGRDMLRAYHVMRC